MNATIFRLVPALVVGAGFFGAPAPSLGDDDLPKVKVENVRRAFHNGEHNAFTDLIRWGGKFWLTFRSCPDGHGVSSHASVIVLSSADAQEWTKVHQFSVPQRDTRDPHFLDFDGKLFVLTGTWWSGDGPLPREKYDLNKHLGYAAWTEDGSNWKGPRQLEGTYAHYIWRAAAHDGTAYLCARRKKDYSEKESGAGGTEVVESAMLESEDGFNWRFRSFFQETRGNETAFQFLEDGSILAVSRAGSEKAQLARSQPPFTEWERKDLPAYIGGPLLAKWGDRWVVGGRRSTGDGPKTTLYWLADDQIHSFAELPSGGDNSYPGFVELDDGRGLVSWYSSHEKNEDGKSMTAVYLAELTIEGGTAKSANPSTVLQAFLDAGRKGDFNAAWKTIARFEGAPAEYEKHLEEEIGEYVGRMKQGEMDFRILESKTDGDCAVVMIDENPKPGETAIDYDPIFLTRQNQKWKVMPDFSDWKIAKHLAPDTVPPFEKLQAWFKKRKAEMKQKQKGDNG